jgi:anthranilate phosphoribosyltransferase
LSFIYLPQHFPLAYNLVTYREQIGKRPPLATLELIWSPWPKNVHIIAGFVHPPTEKTMIATFALRSISNFTTVKGLEGSCDLSRSRTAIIGLSKLAGETSVERLLLHPEDYGFGGKDEILTSKTQLIEQLKAVLQGKSSELMPGAIFNGGFYLWRLGVCADLAAGFARAEAMLTQGKAAAKLRQIATSVG